MTVEFSIPRAAARAIGADRWDFAKNLSADDSYYETRAYGEAVFIRCSREMAGAIRTKLAELLRRPLTIEERMIYDAAMAVVELALQAATRQGDAR